MDNILPRSSHSTNPSTSDCGSYNGRDRCGTFEPSSILIAIRVGSETTGAAILDLTSKSFKTGIASRALKPVLGVVVSAICQVQFDV
jgi:hypothetical protein